MDATRERARTVSATPPSSLKSMTSRDRHGRGLRRPLHPLGSPGALSRSEVFDDLLLDAAERLEARWGREWLMLANPTYGSFDTAPFGHDFKKSREEQRKAKWNVLESWSGPKQ